jgi:hypothetical protein
LQAGLIFGGDSDLAVGNGLEEAEALANHVGVGQIFHALLINQVDAEIEIVAHKFVGVLHGVGQVATIAAGTSSAALKIVLGAGDAVGSCGVAALLTSKIARRYVGCTVAGFDIGKFASAVPLSGWDCMPLMRAYGVGILVAPVAVTALSGLFCAGVVIEQVYTAFAAVIATITTAIAAAAESEKIA